MAGDVAQSTMDAAKYVPALAPILLVAIGYVDPGNWACAIEGGSRFGFELLWVVIVSNVMAALFQTLAVRLGLVSGKHLAEICREDYPRPVCLLLWLLSELSIISLDLTMVAGTAIGLNLLFDFPIFPSVLVLAFDGIIVMLFLPIVGVRRAELVAGSVAGFALLCFGFGALVCRPSASAMMAGLWPKVRGDSLYTAVGLIGANVVPHTFYLHSALLQKQHTLVGQSKDDVVQENMRDTLAAFGIALMANVAVLVVAASTFHNVGLVILTLQDAHALMEQILSNSIAPMVFGLALLCAGQLSSLTGTLTGKVTMEGFLDMSMQPWLHRSLVRAVAVIPAAFCALRYGSEGLYRLLLFSQILIAVELPFSAVPLIKASASEARMGSYRISSLVESTAWISVALVVVANSWLVFDLLLQEIDGTDSFGHYVEGSVNTSVFALVLIGIGLCLGFLVWLVVTPLRVDRIAMERKWVLEYELFERNERENQELVHNRLALSEFSPGSTTAEEDYDMIPMTEDIMLANNLVALEYPRRPEIVLSGEDIEPALEPVAWPSSLSTSGSDIDEDCSNNNKQFGMLKLFETSKPNGMIRALEIDKASELFVVSPDGMMGTELSEGVVIFPEDDGIQTPALVDLEPAMHVAMSGGKATVYEPVLYGFNEKPREEEKVEGSLFWVVEGETKKIEGIDRARHVLTEPEIAGTIATFLKDTSFSANEMAESCRSRPISGPSKPRTHVSMAADDVESVALKKAEAEADADMIGKDEDDADDMESGDVVVGPLSHGTLGHSYSNLAYDGPGSARSLGGRSDVGDCNAGGSGSGSGSSSRLSGLGRAARRQFAAHLDEFWGKLFDLHGQSIARSKGSSSNVRSASAMGSAAAPSFEPSITPRSVDSGRLSSLDYSDRDGSSGYKRGVSKSTSSLQQQVNQMEAYVRAHSNSNASTSSGIPGLTRGFSGSRGETLSPYLAERQYSSLRSPVYSEEFDRQPATIHGYYAPSFLSRSATSSPAHKSSGPMAPDMSSARALSGQAHAQQPLGIGVEFEGSQLYGGAYQASLEDTIRNLRSSQHSMNALASRSHMSYKPSIDRDLDGHMSFKPSIDRDLDGPRSLDSRMYERATADPLMYRATGELQMPSSGYSPIGRLGFGSGERAPLSFDEISPLSRRDGFSIQSAQQEQNSLWSRQPFEQLFGGVADNGGLSSSNRLRNVGPSRSGGGGGGGGGGSMGRSVRPSRPDSFSNNAMSFGSSGSDADLETMENLKACICKLLSLDGSEWLFRVDNGSDEDLIAAVSAVEKLHLEEDAPDRVSRWQAHGLRPVSSLSKTSSGDARRVCYCGDACIWGKGLLVSFGVWCVHRVLELSLIESRPELWGKYTYVLNRLQGILEPAFSKPRIVPAMCSCVLEAGSDILSKRGGGRGGLMKQGSSAFRDTINADLHSHVSAAQTSAYPYPWPWGRNSSSSKGRGASATVFLEMIKEVEQAVGSRKGRTGTAAGDVAFPKGKENLASVLKRYKRRLGNKPPGAAVGGGGGSGSGGGSGGGGRSSRSNGYAQALVFAACLSFVLLPPC